MIYSNLLVILNSSASMLLGGYLEDYAAYVLKKSLVSTPFNWIKV
jgi:hypothetical protein